MTNYISLFNVEFNYLWPKANADTACRWLFLFTHSIILDPQDPLGALQPGYKTDVIKYLCYPFDHGHFKSHFMINSADASNRPQWNHDVEISRYLKTMEFQMATIVLKVNDADLMVCIAQRVAYLLFPPVTWWHHQMVTFSALLALCAGNSSVTGEFP